MPTVVEHIETLLEKNDKEREALNIERRNIQCRLNDIKVLLNELDISRNGLLESVDEIAWGKLKAQLKTGWYFAKLSNTYYYIDPSSKYEIFFDEDYNDRDGRITTYTISTECKVNINCIEYGEHINNDSAVKLYDAFFSDEPSIILVDNDFSQLKEFLTKLTPKYILDIMTK